MRLTSLALCLAATFAEEGPHNTLEEWAGMFSSFDRATSHGRRLDAAPTIEFSLPQIHHRGSVDVIVTAPQLVNNTKCNVTYVALFSPPTADINTTTPIRYQSLMYNPSFCQSGNASFNFVLHNLHTDGYVAYLLQGGVHPTTLTTNQTTYLKSGSKPWVDVTGVNPNVTLGGKVLAVTPSHLTFLNPNEPTHVRVTAGVVAGTYKVSWNQGPLSTGGFLRWSGMPNQTANSGGYLINNASRWSCSLNDVCSLGPAAGPGFRSMGVQYSVSVDLTRFSGLTAYYAVGDKDTHSKTFVLKVPLLPGETSDSPQDWVLFADNGVGYGDDSYNGRNYNNGKIASKIIQATSIEAQLRRLQGVIVNGDVSYADGYLAQMEDYMDLAEPFASMVPFLTTVGNHETDWYYNHNGTNYDSPDGSTPTGSYWNTETQPGISISSGGECGVAMKVWPQGAATATKPWYSYASGLLTAVFISTEHNFTRGSEQWDWINATLSRVNRTLTPWLLVSGHRPMYLSYDNSDPGWGGITSTSDLMREHLEPLWKKYDVSLTLAGHVHNTQRMCAVGKGICTGATELNSNDGFHEYINPPDPVYLLLGSAGANVDVLGVNLSSLLLWGKQEPAYAVLSVVSAEVLEIRLVDPVLNYTFDKSRIVREGGSKPTYVHWAIIVAVVGVCVFALFVMFYSHHRRKRDSVHPETYRTVV